MPALNEGAKPSQRALSLNPVGKSSVQLLHEFVQKVLKNNVLYEDEALLYVYIQKVNCLHLPFSAETLRRLFVALRY